MDAEYLLLCLLFSMTPRSTLTQDDESNDPRWRMVSGMKAAREYASYQQAVALYQPPIVSVTGELEPVLKNVCDLVFFRELMADVDNGSALHDLLDQNIQESCNWLNYLIDNDPNVTGTGTGVLELPSSCAVDDVTSLHSYCFQMAVREQDQLKDLIHRNLYDPISDYYSGTVTGSSSSTWLETSSIPPSQQSSIAPYL